MQLARWTVFIHLGTSDAVRHNEPPRNIGVVKAGNRAEAEHKGSLLAQIRGLSGLIEVKQLPN